MPYFILFIAGILEITWAAAMKESHGLTRPWPVALMLVAMVGSFWLLALAMRQLPLGTSYMIWTGIGAVGSFALGVVLFGEPLSALRLTAAGLIVGGLVLMGLAS